MVQNFPLILLSLPSNFSRPFQGIRGFSRETFIAVTTNIESQEYRRREKEAIGWAEHPRAGTTDDVECFFSLCHQKLGSTFTLKDFKYRWRKICKYVALYKSALILYSRLAG